MRAKQDKAGLIFPLTIHLATFYRGYIGQELPSEKEVAKQLVRGESEIAANQGQIKVLSDVYNYMLKTVDEEESRTFIITILPKKVLRQQTLPSFSEKIHQKISTSLEKLTPSPSSIFNISIQYAKNIEDCDNIVKKYSQTLNRKVTSSGIIRNNILTTLKEDANRLRKYFLLCPTGKTVLNAIKSLEDFIEDISSLASSAGRLEGVYLQRKVVFNQIELSEKSTQEKISRILEDVQFKRRRMEPADLESVLNEVSGIFSNLTVLATAMRRDSLKASGFLRNIQSLLNAWDETKFMGFPLNTKMEYDDYEKKTRVFDDTLNRVDALTSRASMVLDTVRTYVGIQQQKTSVEEQRYSRGLLKRMVNLQEILHKLEILIVAFYITEMGRIVFEYVAPERVHLFTAMFIPAALILAIVIRKLLHR